MGLKLTVKWNSNAKRFEWERIPDLQKNMNTKNLYIIYIILAILIQIGFCFERARMPCTIILSCWIFANCKWST